MAYTPSTLTIASWTVPISIVGTDAIADLDNSVNAILDTDVGSAKAHINTELAKLPTYLSGEMTSIYNDLAGQVNVIAGLSASADELNILDGATLTTTELNILDGINGLSSGSYTPTVTNVTNISSATVNECHYTRVGSVVTLAGKFYINQVAAGTSRIRITIPVASVFTASTDCSGTVSSGGTTPITGNSYADVASGEIALSIYTSSSAANYFYFSLSYKII